MRLSEHQREVIRRSAVELAGASAKVLLFGSRLNDQARGGDIDILVELPELCPDRLALSLRIGARIERQLGLQKIDVLVADPATPLSGVLSAARRMGLPV
jgi:predicted nucleotidyltransferase